MTDKTGTEIIAREIALLHGSAMAINSQTIAAIHGYGSWGHSLEKYSDNYWRQYIGAAEAMLARLNHIEEPRQRKIEVIADDLPTYAHCYKSPSGIEIPTKSELLGDAGRIIDALNDAGYVIVHGTMVHIVPAPAVVVNAEQQGLS